MAGTSIIDLFVFAAVVGLLLFALYSLLNMAKEALDVDPPGLKAEPFLRDNGFSWDFVFVFQVWDEDDKLDKYQTDNSLKKTVARLNKGGLETKLFYSAQRDEVYVKVRCSLDRLQREADRIDYSMLLDDNALRRKAEVGKRAELDGSWIWEPLHIPDDPDLTHYRPFRHMYGKYDTDPDLQEIYALHRNEQMFRSVDRIKLIINIMEARLHEGGCQMNLAKMVQKKAVLAAFPLHDYSHLFSLQQRWLTFFQWPWHQPVNEIKDYFGEKIGLYFLWLGHYTSWLLGPSIMGLAAFIDVFVEQNNDAVFVPYFAGFMALWATFFLEFWKRKESTHAMTWGMTGFEDVEEDRPEFDGELIESPVDGSPMLFFPPGKYSSLLAQSQIIIFMLICMVIGAVAGVFILKFIITREPVNGQLTVLGIATASIIASVANAVQIQVMNAVYGGIAEWLNDRENHKTDTVYEDNLIAKVFMFQFVNSYAPMFYIAFIKQNIGDPCLGTCMAELSTVLGTVFITRLLVGNLQEIAVPALMNHLRQKAEMEGVEPGTVITPVEKQYVMEEYHVLLGTFKDYAEMAIQYGYASLFVAAFPLAPLMAFVNNYIEMRVDGWKLCQIMRRPLPRGAEDIGTWYSILEIMSAIAVVMNSALICFTGTFLINYSLYERMIFFVALEHMLFLVKFALALIVDDVPPDVEMQLERREFIVGKVIENLPDDNDDDLIIGIEQEMDFRIARTDDDWVEQPEPAGKKGFLGKLLGGFGGDDEDDDDDM